MRQRAEQSVCTGRGERKRGSLAINRNSVKNKCTNSSLCGIQMLFTCRGVCWRSVCLLSFWHDLGQATSHPPITCFFSHPAAVCLHMCETTSASMPVKNCPFIPAVMSASPQPWMKTGQFPLLLKNSELVPILKIVFPASKLSTKGKHLN